MRLAVLAAVLGLAAGTCGAQPLGAKNLAFERWDAQGRLEGWSVQAGPSYYVTSDCEQRREGRCVLKIASRGEAMEAFQPVTQVTGAGAAAGHRLTLSGWIRTQDVAPGWAGLWLRVEVERKVIVLENMLNEGPRGTSPWRRFEVSVPVAANATLIAFGVLLTGPGNAWFDDLQLTVDHTVTVGPAPKTQVVDPPRPRPTQRLADDAALALAAGSIPPVRAAWQEEARRSARPIRSLFSDDFSDLQFLKPILAGRRVVQLGESAHGVAEFSWLKVRLIKFLHREMGFDVIAFESSLSACDIANARVGVDPPLEVMRACIFGTWFSSETLGLFDYLDATRRSARPLELAGFDVQNSGRARTEASARLVRQVARVDAELAQKLKGYEERLQPPLAADEAIDMRAAYAAAAARLARERDALAKLESRPLEVDFAIQEARSRVRYVGQLATHRQPESSRIRDEGMADNLDFLLDRAFPGRKVIVWAHNFHVEKRRADSAPRAMGAWVAERRGQEVYTLGLFMGRGVATWNNRAPYEIVAPPADTLEAVLASAGWKTSFTDFSRAAATEGSWMRSPIEARDWGVQPITITPALSFDGVIYIDTVTPPEYL